MAHELFDAGAPAVVSPLEQRIETEAEEQAPAHQQAAGEESQG
jgi:hypothetical protein